MHDRRQRQEDRVRLGGSVRLLVDTPTGLRTATGQVIDLSEGGCAIRVQRIVEAELAGRVLVEVARKAIWLPIVTRWVRRDLHGWVVGCQFDRPTPEKARAIRSLLWERRRLTA